MIKVVLDTNIFISSIFWKLGNPHKVVDLALNKKFKVYTSLEILKELQRVLLRDFMEDKELVNTQINLILEYCELINPQQKLNVVKEDPSDNKILECALESNANFIVTGNKHLLKIGEFNNIKIVKPTEFLSIIR